MNLTLNHRDKKSIKAIDDTFSDDESEASFLYHNDVKPWPLNLEEVQNRVPDEWLEEYSGTVRIIKNRLNTDFHRFANRHIKPY